MRLKTNPISLFLVLLFSGIFFFSIAKAYTGYDPNNQSQMRLYDEARTVYLGNLARRDNGVPPLRWNRELTHAARWFSWDSTQNRPAGFCGHQDSLGGWPGDRARAFGYLGSAGAENAFCGYVSPEYAINGWMNSPGHRENLLSPGHREIGLGYYRRDGDGRGYVSQKFGADPVYAPVIIEHEALLTSNRRVNLHIYDRQEHGGFAGQGNAVEMMISNDPYFQNATWEPYQPEKTWELEPGQGWREVYVKTRDIFNRTMTASDIIYLGDDFPLDEFGPAQMATTQPQVTLYNLNANTYPLVQLSLGWLATNTYPTFGHLWGNGERVSDPQATGKTAYRLYPGNGESFAWVWDTSFIKDTPMTAYFRLKVNNNTSNSEVARISISAGGTQYGPIILTGTDFSKANEYQEIPLNFTFHTNSDDVFLIFQIWRSGNTDVYFDSVSIFSAPQPIVSPLIWTVPGNNYRGQGVLGRYTNGSQFSDIFDVDPFSLVKISGNTGEAHTTLTYTDKFVKTITTDEYGNYAITVPYGWSGAIRPSKFGYFFTPESRQYTEISSDIQSQDFIATKLAFPDVPADHWAWAHIERLADAGITSGFPDGTYRPENNVTRAEIAVFLLKGMKFPAAYTPPQAAEFNFSDIESHWGANWIETLRASGITGGFADGTYRPEEAVTRGQMAVFLLKALNDPGYTPPPATPTFDDTEGHWASNWIEALRSTGLTSGYPDGTFRPDSPVTRAEMAVFIVNAFGLP